MQQLLLLAARPAWTKTRQSGDGWSTEHPAVGLERLTEGFAQPSGTLASSYGWCETMRVRQAEPSWRLQTDFTQLATHLTCLQAVDLVEALTARGLTQQVACAFLDLGPAIHFQFW